MVYRLIFGEGDAALIVGDFDEARTRAKIAAVKLGKEVEIEESDEGKWTEVEFVCPTGSEISTLRSPQKAPASGDFGFINREPGIPVQKSPAVFAFTQGRAAQNPLFFV